MPNNVGVLTAGPDQIEATWKALTPAILDAMIAQWTPQQIADAEWKVAHGEWTSIYSAQMAAGFLFGLAALALIGRVTVRLLTNRKLSLDDGFLLFAFLNLIGGTAVFYSQIHLLYLEWGATQGTSTQPDFLITLLALRHMNDFFEMSKWRIAYFFFLWTTIFAVKGCYLAFFRPFLRARGKAIAWYFWFVVGLTAVSWPLLVMGDSVIVCPHVGKASIKCAPNLSSTSERVNVVLWLNAVLDAFTDVLIVIIPIWVLRTSTMPLSTKLGLGIFLCLSSVMFICSIIRATGIRNNAGSNDYPWTTFWLHVEGCIAIVMASITVYRSTLTGSNELSDKFRAALGGFRRKRSADAEKQATSDGTTPSRYQLRLFGLPGATLTGLRTMFDMEKTVDSSKKGSGLSSLDSDMEPFEIDYHAHLKQGSPSTFAPSTFQPAHLKQESSSSLEFQTNFLNQESSSTLEVQTNYDRKQDSASTLEFQTSHLKQDSSSTIGYVHPGESRFTEEI